MWEEVGLAALVRAHRRRAMISQEELARRAGISVRTVSDIERGLQTTPRAATLSGLSAALGLSAVEAERLVAASRTSDRSRGIAEARAARDAGAWQLAVAAYDDALQPLLERSEPDDSTADALLELGDAATMGLLRHQARPAYLHAARIAVARSSRDRLLHAAIGYSFLTKAGEAGTGAERFWHRTLASTPHDDVEARAVLGAARATALLLDRAWSEARSVASFAHDQAIATGIDSVRAVTAAVCCVAGWGDADPARRLALADEVVDGIDLPIPRSGLEGLELRAVPLLQLGRLEEFAEVVKAFEEAAWQAPTHSVAAQAAQWQAAEHLLAGDVERALEAAARAVETAGSPPNFTLGFHAQVYCALRLQGRTGEITGLLRDLAAERPAEPAWLAATALALVAGSDPSAPDRHEAGLLVERIVRELWPLEEGWAKLVSLAFLAEVAAILGHAELGQKVEESLAPYQGQFVVVATGTSCEGSVERALASAAWARGDRDLARRRFSAAVEAEESAGMSVLAESTRTLAARLDGTAR